MTLFHLFIFQIFIFCFSNHLKLFFHVSQLKRALGNHQQVHQLVHFINEKHEWLTLPEEIYGYRKNPATKDWVVLVSWKGLSPHEATWEDCNDFRQQFPDFHLEDEVDLEESDVRPPIFLNIVEKIIIT